MTEENNQVIRSFIAMEINDEVRDGLFRAQVSLKKSGTKVAWVAPQNIHLTLVFLGTIFDSKVAELKPVLDEVASGTFAFGFGVQDVGFFGTAKAPQVIWAGIDDESQSLRDIQQRLSERVAGLGIKLEDRPFRPHLTLGRVRSTFGVDRLTSALQSVRSTHFGRVDVKRLLLMQSHMEPQGVRYTILHEASLKGA